MNGQNGGGEPQVQLQPSVPAVGPKLLGTFDLIGETFRIFGKRWKTLVMIEVIPAVISLGMWIIQALIGRDREIEAPAPVLLAVVLFVLIILAAFFGLWATYSLMVAVVKQEDGRGWKDYYKDSLKIFWGILGVSILVGLVIVGGFFLLIVPGFIFGVWFGFATWAYIERGKGSGIVKALRESKRVVKGYFWSIVWRNFVFSLLMGIAALAVMVFFGILGVVIGSALSGNNWVGNLIGNILGIPIQLVLTPVFLLFPYLLYRNVKELKAQGAEKKPLSTAVKILVPAVIVLFFVVSMFLGFLTVNVWGSARLKARDAGRISDIKQMKTMLEIHKSQQGIYPSSLDEMGLEARGFKDPKSEEPYYYEAFNEGRDFELCADLEAEGEGSYCASGEIEMKEKAGEAGETGG